MAALPPSLLKSRRLTPFRRKYSWTSWFVSSSHMIVSRNIDWGEFYSIILADLIVLDQNPLDDIRYTNTVRYVIKNSELFDGDDLDMIWREEKPLPPFSLPGFRTAHRDRAASVRGE